LTVDFLKGTQDAQDFLKDIPGEQYGGYNLIAGHVKTGLWWSSNRARGVYPITPGIHGVANHLMDTPWPKVQGSKCSMGSLLRQDLDEASLVEGLFEILSNRKKAKDEELPDTGIGVTLERAWSSTFVATDTYGTRASTVVLAHRNGEVTFIERSYGSDSKLIGKVEYRLSI
jgi:uncharacterized protein with NRDE domain